MAPHPIPASVRVIRQGRLTAWVIPYGARLMQVFLDDQPLCLGLANPEDYEREPASLGAVCGRYGNRIGGGVLERDGQRWQLDQNEGEQCLHGGAEGFGRRQWQVEQHSDDLVTLTLDSADGDQGWPGRCQAQVRYALTPDGLEWEASARVDKACPINLIQHAYWNLGASAAEHRLQMPATHCWNSDERQLPTACVPVSGDTDFRAGRVIGHHDHDRTFMVPGAGMRHAATLSGPLASLAIYSDQPSIQLYCAKHLFTVGPAIGAAHEPGNAVCLETQQLPNGPALGQDVWLEPGRPYRHRMRFQIAPKDPVT